MSFETDITVIIAGLTDDTWRHFVTTGYGRNSVQASLFRALGVVKHASLHNLSCSFSFSFRGRKYMTRAGYPLFLYSLIYGWIIQSNEGKYYREKYVLETGFKQTGIFQMQNMFLDPCRTIQCRVRSKYKYMCTDKRKSSFMCIMTWRRITL